MSAPTNPDAVPRLRLRASGSDRESSAGILHAALADGMLTADEFDERVQLVYSARYQDELTDLVADVAHVVPPSTTPIDRPHRYLAMLNAALLSLFMFAGRHRRGVLITLSALVLVGGLATVAAGFEVFGDGDHPHQMHHGDEG